MGAEEHFGLMVNNFAVQSLLAIVLGACELDHIEQSLIEECFRWYRLRFIGLDWVQIEELTQYDLGLLSVRWGELLFSLDICL